MASAWSLLSYKLEIMAVDFVPTSPDEQTQVVEFLLSAFQLDARAPFVDDRLLRWKYFSPRTDWTAPRSYVYKQRDRIIAHGCVWPVTFLTAGGPVTSMRVIDWAGSRAVPGSGAAIMKKMGSLTQTLLAVGGSTETQSVAPAMGFKILGQSDQYARVVRPWTQLRSSPIQNWKSPARLIRNTWWSIQPRAAVPKGWSTKRVTAFDEVSQRQQQADMTTCRRDAGMLNYALQCPVGNLAGYLILRDGDSFGYFLTSRMGRQSRIADLWIESSAEADWDAAYSLAVAAAASDPETCEIATVASVDRVRSALERNGFQLRRRSPIFVYDPKGCLAEAPPLHLNLLDGDEFFLYDPAYPFLT